MTVVEAIARVACVQHGLITRTQALAAGLTEGQIRRRIRQGEWLAVRPGVYAIAGAPPAWHQTVLAATLAAEPRAWASHHTAGVLWGFPGITADGIDVLIDEARRLRLPGVTAHRSSSLFSADLGRCQRIAVTAPARTLVDLSAGVTVPQLGQILDDALRRRIVRLEPFRRCVARLEAGPGRRTTAIHEVLGRQLPGYEPLDSDLETYVLRLIAASGMDLPVQQYRVRLGGRTYRIDLAYPDIKLAIELDGWTVHGSRSAFDDDRVRANALTVAGWTILRFTSCSSDGEILRSIRTAHARLVARGSYVAAE